ncbi:MAG: PQQ-binding-like beta-propeller repeat protein [Pirellulaceae bacterium]|nr:PQQ-binding-like beta-propeller repeat protein [Pirellulaceae bacterium]
MNLAFRFCFVFCWIALNSTPSVVLAVEDWTQFRGPQGDGMIPKVDLPLEWSESTNVRWFTKIPGLGWSSPVVVGNRIYVTTAVAESEDAKSLAGPQQLRLVCIDSQDGRELFNRQVLEQGKEAPKVHEKNSHASPTPIVDGDRLYLHFGHQGTVATDMEGNVVWKNCENPYPPTHGNGASPVIVGDLLIVTCDGGDKPGTIALDKRSGKEVWRTPRDVAADRKFSFCSPSIFHIDGQDQLISAGSNIVQSLDPKNGKVIWSVQYDGYSVVPKPIMSQGLVYICTGFGPTTLLAIDPSGKGDVTETHVRWKYKSQNVPKTSSVVAYRDQIIMASDQGVSAAVDCKTGGELWKKRLGGNYSASPLLNGDNIYFQSEQGDAVVLQLGEEPIEIAKNTLPGRIFASYAIVDNHLLIRAEGGLYRIGK